MTIFHALRYRTERRQSVLMTRKQKLQPALVSATFFTMGFMLVWGMKVAFGFGP